MNIDITKKYQTRSGLKVHLYEERNGYIYGRYCEPHLGQVLDCWTPASWNAYGICNQNIGTGFDLTPAKTWRAWEDGEAPKICMLKNKTSGIVSIFRTEGWRKDFRARIFHEYVRVHEDGSETPCGVLEQ